MDLKSEYLPDASHVDWSVYFLVGRSAAQGRSILDVVRAAIQGGVTAVQLRDKQASTRELIQLGAALHEITRAAEIPLVINDRVDVALAIGAEGVHVGQDDMPAALARRIIGPSRLLGVSVRTVEEAETAVRDGADHLGVGDLFGTASKPDAGPAIGVTRLAEIARTVSLPIVGIGGITLENAASVIAAGAAGAAVISAILGAADPEVAAARLHAVIQEGTHGHSDGHSDAK